MHKRSTKSTGSDQLRSKRLPTNEEKIRKAGEGDFTLFGIMGISVHDAVIEVGAAFPAEVEQKVCQDSNGLGQCDAEGAILAAMAMWMKRCFGPHQRVHSKLQQVKKKLEGEYLDTEKLFEQALENSEESIKEEDERSGQTDKSPKPIATKRFTVTEVACYVGVHENTMRRWLKDGVKLTATDVGGGHYEFLLRELDAQREAVKQRKGNKN